LEYLPEHLPMTHIAGRLEGERDEGENAEGDR
jgi:hypothetical protein